MTPLLCYFHEFDDALSRDRSKPLRNVVVTSSTVHGTTLCHFNALVHRPKAYLAIGKSRTIVRVLTRIGYYLCIGSRWYNGWIHEHAPACIINELHTKRFQFLDVAKCFTLGLYMPTQRCENIHRCVLWPVILID